MARGSRACPGPVSLHCLVMRPLIFISRSGSSLGRQGIVGLLGQDPGYARKGSRPLSKDIL